MSGICQTERFFFCLFDKRALFCYHYTEINYNVIKMSEARIWL